MASNSNEDEKWRQVITESYADLIATLTLDHVLDELITRRVISLIQFEDIHTARNTRDKKKSLLGAVRRGGYIAIQIFILALKQDEFQNYNKLLSAAGKLGLTINEEVLMPTAVQDDKHGWRDVVVESWKSVVDKLFLVHIVDFCLTKGILSDEQMETFDNPGTPMDKKRFLLYIVANKGPDKIQTFMAGLQVKEPETCAIMTTNARKRGLVASESAATTDDGFHDG